MQIVIIKYPNIGHTKINKIALSRKPLKIAAKISKIDLSKNKIEIENKNTHILSHLIYLILYTIKKQRYLSRETISKVATKFPK